MIKENDESLT